MINGSCNGICHSSSNSNSLTEGGFNSSMHINRMFDDASELINDEQLIDEVRRETNDWDQRNTSTPTCSQINLIANQSQCSPSYFQLNSDLFFYN